MNTSTTYTEAKTAKKEKAVSKFWVNAEHDRYGWRAVQLLILGCIGGICAASVLPVSLIGIAIIGLFTVTSLTTMLAALPMKWILGTGALALIVDMLVVLVTLL